MFEFCLYLSYIMVISQPIFIWRLWLELGCMRTSCCCRHRWRPSWQKCCRRSFGRSWSSSLVAWTDLSLFGAWREGWRWTRWRRGYRWKVKLAFWTELGFGEEFVFGEDWCLSRYRWIGCRHCLVLLVKLPRGHLPQRWVAKLPSGIAQEWSFCYYYSS